MGFFDKLKGLFDLDSFYNEPETKGNPTDVVTPVLSGDTQPDLSATRPDLAATNPVSIVEPVTSSVSDDAHLDQLAAQPTVMMPAQGPHQSAIGDLPTLSSVRAVEPSAAVPQVNINGISLPDLNAAKVMPDVTQPGAREAALSSRLDRFPHGDPAHVRATARVLTHNAKLRVA